MEVILSLAIGVLVAAGVWLILRPRTYQVIVGPKGVKAGEIEIKDRKTGERETLATEAGLERTIRRVIDQRVLA